MDYSTANLYREGLFMNLLKKSGFYLLVIVVIAELSVPFFLAGHYPNYDSITMLISDFGEEGSPVRHLFKFWQLIDGSLFLLTIPSFYLRFSQTSPVLAKWLGVMMATFAIGDCITTGILDRSTNPLEAGMESLVHDYASGAGFTALLAATFLLILLYKMENNSFVVRTFTLIFILSLCLLLLYAAPKLPGLNTLNIPYRGLWQRLNLLFLYLPFFFVALKNL